MAGEKYNIQLEAVEIFNRLIQVPQLAEGLSNLLQNFNSHNHDIRNDERYQPLGDYQPLGNYAASVHEHQASDIQETADKKVMTAEERNILSTLGTKSILVESQSLGQNGYLKCSNGLLIQWGKHSGSTSPSVTIYLTESFLDADYIIQGSIIKDASDNNVYSALPIANPTKSSFKLDRNFSSTGTGVSSAKFNWIAIGRWE